MPSYYKVKKGYRTIVRLKGYRDTSAVLPTKAMAERWAAKTYEAMCANKYFGTAFAMTYKELMRDYMDKEAVLRQSYDTQWLTETHLEIFLPYFKDKAIDQISTRDILDIRASWVKKWSPAYINRIIKHLSTCFAYAVICDLIPSNPCTRVKPLSVPPKKERILSPTEEVPLFAALYCLDVDTYHVARFALDTGARRGEITKLRMSDINLTNQTLTFKQTKNKKDRTIPIPASWLHFLSVQPVSFRFVFRQGYWAKAKKQVTINDLRFHDLRHTFITRAIAQGKSPALVSAFVGHSSLGMTGYYTHLTTDDLRGVI